MNDASGTTFQFFEIGAKNAIDNDLSYLQMITRFESLSATSRPVTNRRHEVLRLNNALREVEMNKCYYTICYTPHGIYGQIGYVVNTLMVQTDDHIYGVIGYMVNFYWTRPWTINPAWSVLASLP